MTNLEEYKKGKREEYWSNFSSISKTEVEKFLDNLVDETIEMCEQEVVPSNMDAGHPGSEAVFWPPKELGAEVSGFNGCRIKVLEAFSRLKEKKV